MQYLNSWCLVRQQKIIKNGQTVFEDNAAETDAFLVNAYKHQELAYPKFYKMDNLSKLGFLASEHLLDGQHLPSPENTGVILANRHSSLDTDARYFHTIQSFPSPSLFVYTLANVMVGEMCIRHQLKGENTVFIFDQYDIPFLCNYINGLLANGEAEAVIGGWVDVMEGHFEAFLYLASPMGTDNAIIHDHKNIATLYGKPDAGSETADH